MQGTPVDWSALELHNPHIDGRVFEWLKNTKYGLQTGLISSSVINKPILLYIVNVTARKLLYQEPDVLLITEYDSIKRRILWGPVTYKSLKFDPTIQRMRLIGSTMSPSKSGFFIQKEGTGAILIKDLTL